MFDHKLLQWRRWWVSVDSGIIMKNKLHSMKMVIFGPWYHHHVRNGWPWLSSRVPSLCTTSGQRRYVWFIIASRYHILACRFCMTLLRRVPWGTLGSRGRRWHQKSQKYGRERPDFGWLRSLWRSRGLKECEKALASEARISMFFCCVNWYPPWQGLHTMWMSGYLSPTLTHPLRTQ